MIKKEIKLISEILFLMIKITNYNLIKAKDDEETIHILIWEGSQNPAIEGKGLHYFTANGCKYVNCYLTSDKTLIDIKNFDVILFDGNKLTANTTLPASRSKWQKYIFMSNKSPSNVVPASYNDYFNLTWTYKLDSDTLWRYFIVRDMKGEILGPGRIMQWLDKNDMEPIKNTTLEQLQDKTIAAVWYPMECSTASKREQYVEMLSTELEKYDLNIDIFGPCGKSNKSYEKYVFNDLVETKYYFYLAFETVFCEDYVSEEVLTATDHFAVPIVYGGADYNRFLPPGSYLNAVELKPQELAKIMYDAIKDKNKYYKYFKWRSYYDIFNHKESGDTDEVCALCTYLNEIKREYLYKRRVYTNITKFWEC